MYGVLYVEKRGESERDVFMLRNRDRGGEGRGRGTWEATKTPWAFYYALLI